MKPASEGFCEGFGFWFVGDEMRSARGEETSPETWGVGSDVVGFVGF
jgi:hypothetical protein